MNIISKFAEQLHHRQRFSQQVDTTKFSDPLAQAVDWKPLKGGGTSFQTKKLFTNSMGKLYYRPTRGAYFFYRLFISIGLGVGAVGVYLYITKGNLFGDAGRLFILHPIIFLGVGGYMLRRATKNNYVFDAALQIAFKGKQPNDDFLAGSTSDLSQERIHFRDIHALQIIAERVQMKNSSFLSYELNMVLENGERQNIIDHGKSQVVKADAVTIGSYVSVPVWDATM